MSHKNIVTSTTTTTTKTVGPDRTVIEEKVTTNQKDAGPPLSTTYRASPELQNVENIRSAPEIVANQPSPETLLVEKKIERKQQDHTRS